jgi:hypothetical protein
LVSSGHVTYPERDLYASQPDLALNFIFRDLGCLFCWLELTKLELSHVHRATEAGTFNFDEPRRAHISEHAPFFIRKNCGES